MNSLDFIIIYAVTVNIMGFALMGIDKRRARKHAFRIPEATLFAVALIGGSIGSVIGMQVFRHKTNRPHFKFGMPVILILQAALIAVLFIVPVQFSFI